METPYADPKQLGIAIKKARLNAGWTQDRLADETGTSRKRIGNMEKGDTSTLGESPEEQFAVAAVVAAATGDMTLIGLADPADESELLSLRRDVDRLERSLARTADILVESRLLQASAVPQLLEQLDATGSPRVEAPDEGRV